MDFLGDNGRARSDIMIWGDWAYGPEDDPYNRDMQYGGDIRLEKKLHGDDDVIIMQRRDPQAGTPLGSG